MSIRLPGGEWGEELTLQDVGPGDYLIEAMDSDGNVRTVQVRVTRRDIFARSLRSAADNVSPTAFATVSVLVLLILVQFLAAGYNVTVKVFSVRDGKENKIRSLRRIKFRKKKLIIKLDERHIAGGESVNLMLAKHLSKRMRGKTVILTIPERKR